MNRLSNSTDILRLRVLLCFLSTDATIKTVTGISRTLGEQKYKIARILSTLEKEKLIDKTNPRNPILTDSGYTEAKKYEERIDITLNHLIYEGVDTKSAYHDALYWSLYSTENSMQAIRATEERYRVKYNLRDKSNFSGCVLCKNIKDGTYQLPFVIYTNQIENKTNISSTNDYFEHPCTLIVNGKLGTIQVRTTNMFSLNGKRNRVIRNIQYVDSGIFINAEKIANVFSMPAPAFNFINIGTGVGQILHGSLCLKIQYEEQNAIVEDKAIFTILI